MTTDEEFAETKKWIAQNAHFLCTCGHTFGRHYMDLDSCADCDQLEPVHLRCDGFRLDRSATYFCKHCELRIQQRPGSPDWVHAEGDQCCKHTCALDPYGYHAEPVGAPCGNHPANPCNGARNA
jgi:hypothetical protein